MNIKINYLLVFALLLFWGNTALGQTIQGKIILNDNWKAQLYLIELSHYEQVFSGNSGIVTDSVQISRDGSFIYGKLKKSTLYRLNAIPKDERNGAYFIQDGEHDNFAYFVTDGSKATIQFKGNIDHLYASYSISSEAKPLNDLLTQIMHIRSIKFMHYNFMHQYNLSEQAINPADTIKIAELQSKAVQQLMHNDDSLNVILSKYSSTLKNPQVLSLALVWFGLGFQSNKAVQQAKPRLAKATHSPLAISIVEAINSAPPQNTSADFMRKDYPLISGGTIRLSNVSSDYILLDFWASWCVPCRKGITTTIRYLEEKYDEKHLTIIGIALEAEKEKVLKAMQKDNNNAIQIYDGLQPELKRIFEVVDIPCYVLINTRTGTIKRIMVAESVDEIMSSGK